MPTPGSKVCSASGWPMPRMNTLTLLDEPRPCAMFMFGTAPCRPSTVDACRSLICSSPKALTATGTSMMDSVRRRAVTVTSSSCVACVPAGTACCSCACTNAAGASRMPPIAMLKYLRFIGLPPPGYDATAKDAAHAAQVNEALAGCVSSLRTVGRSPRHADTRRIVLAGSPGCRF
ncbi:hypothetical protein D3C81_1548650 [compost metagenome]